MTRKVRNDGRENGSACIQISNSCSQCENISHQKLFSMPKIKYVTINCCRNKFTIFSFWFVFFYFALSFFSLAEQWKKVHHQHRLQMSLTQHSVHKATRGQTGSKSVSNQINMKYNCLNDFISLLLVFIVIQITDEIFTHIC